MEQVVDYGIITLLPPIFVITFAIITRRVFEALLLGSVFGFIISDGLGFFEPFLDSLYTVIEENAWMWMTLGLFGSFVLLLTKSKGSFGFARIVLKHSKTAKKSLLMTWLLSWLIFMDDYLNILTLAACIKNVADKQKVPREMLAYVIASTSAPICVLVPLSTWAVFYGSVFHDQPEITEMGSAMEIYVSALPFVFYGMTAVLVVPLVILGIIPKVFAMKKAYARVESGGNVYSDYSSKFNKAEEEVNIETADGKISNFLVPLIVLAGLAIYTEDLLIGLIAAIVVQLLMYLPRRNMNFDQFGDNLSDGFANMIPMLFIILGALSIRISMETIGLPAYVVNAVIPYMNAPLFPAITFVIVATLSFVTGSNWGIPAATVPIIAPLAVLGGANVPMTLGAIVSGGTFGSHACFYSDATVLESMACKMDNLEHAVSQIPYAGISAIIAIVLYVVFGIALT